MTDNYVVTKISGAIATLTLNRPDTLNAIDSSLATAFGEAVDRIVADEAVRVIILKGEGRSFCAGGDVAAFKCAGTNAPEVSRSVIEPFHEALAKLHHSPKVVVAALQGPVVGAGMSLALSADLAVAADNTRFNMGYIKVGNSPDCGGTWYLSRLVGLRKALEITLLSEDVDAGEALALGLVNRVVPAEALDREVEAVASKLSRSAPLAVASIKSLLLEAGTNSLESQLAQEAEQFASNAGSEDFREALAAFFEKRPANFQGK